MPVVRLTNHDIQRIAKAVGSEIGKQVNATMRQDVEPSSISSDEATLQERLMKIHDLRMENERLKERIDSCMARIASTNESCASDFTSGEDFSPSDEALSILNFAFGCDERTGTWRRLRR
ncbi:hypothetical protein [Prevotella sp. P5-64]|uniref:hypothetical protein n=1 Tax=Prevotella sp. P5-64 TaxID=2024226 RepID=UPI00117ECB07|nr:hypothetical protein [Prevotella sp. P5-64]